MNLEILLDDHSNLRRQIIEYFGYEEYLRIFPLINLTDVYWAYDGPHLIYFNEPLSEDVIRSGRHVEASYYLTSESINKYRYETDNYTLFVLKNHMDVMPTLSIFSNQRFMEMREGILT